MHRVIFESGSPGHHQLPRRHAPEGLVSQIGPGSRMWPGLVQVWSPDIKKVTERGSHEHGSPHQSHGSVRAVALADGRPPRQEHQRPGGLRGRRAASEREALGRSEALEGNFLFLDSLEAQPRDLTVGQLEEILSSHPTYAVRRL